MSANKTRARLEVQYPGESMHNLDEIVEFSYSSDVLSVGDVCTAKLVLGDGSILRKVRLGSEVKLYLANAAVNGGAWTLKHRGRVITADSDLDQGTVSLTIPDLGWHLVHCHPELHKRLRGLRLDQVVDPRAKHGLIDPTFGLTTVRAGKDANKLTRYTKQGKALAVAQAGKVLDQVQVIQVEPGDTFFDIMVKYAQRENLLINVGIDGAIQAWNPDYERPPAFRFVHNSTSSNVENAKRHDDATTRYTETVCVGEVVNLGVQLNDPLNPNASKRKGRYRAKTDPKTGLPAPLPFTHRMNFGDGECFASDMAAKLAEWRWKRGMFDSHYLSIDVPDHYQIGTDGLGAWFEADLMASVDFTRLDATGPYYVAQVVCKSAVGDGDRTTLVLRWPHLLSASFGTWRTPTIYTSPESNAAMQKGTVSS